MRFFTLVTGQKCNSDSVNFGQHHLSDLLVVYSLIVICVAFTILKFSVSFSVPVTLHQHLVIVAFHIVTRSGMEDDVSHKQIGSLAAKQENTNRT